MNLTSSLRRSGPALVIVLLVLAVLVTAGLSLEAVRSARTARATAEGVLRDYATIAAVQFVRESQSQLDGLIQSGLSAARQRADTHAVDHAGQRVRDCDCTPPAATRTLFAISRAGLVVLDGDPLEPALVTELAAAVQPTRAAARPAVRLIEGDRLLVTAWGRRGTEPVTVGFVAGAGLLTRVFERVIKECDLLPPTLVEQIDARDVVMVRVMAGAGRVLYQTDETWSPYAGAAEFGALFSPLHAAAAIRPEHASALLIDGLPSERWSLIVGLLVLAAGLMAAAAVQLRREIRFARQRADFVSGVSHELRTPLAQIRLFGETLLLGRVRSSDEARRAAEVIVQESRRLSQMVDNVLLFSRAGRGVAAVQRERIDPAAAIEATVETARPQAASKQAVIRLDAAQAATPVFVDPNALRQVLLNLLDNAVKYGPRGQTIHVRSAVCEGMLRLDVEDEGPGIAPADAARIWEPFWRAPGSAEGGTGLGLAIVRELAARHGGSATVEGGTAGGARFVVTFDAPISSPAAAPVSSGRAANQPA
jgi:signal transduction histidine kinase